MARLARVIVPGLAHHVTQRGNGRAKTFFSDEDYKLYLRLITENCRAARVQCLAYALMPNHVHLILVPKDTEGLPKALAATHGTYASILNGRRKKTGHFWQGRFGCVAMDGPHTEAALRYVLMNPVRAKLVKRADGWPWSSAAALLKGKDDGLTDCGAVQEQFGDVALLPAEGRNESHAREALSESENRRRADFQRSARLKDRHFGRCRSEPPPRGPFDQREGARDRQTE